MTPSITRAEQLKKAALRAAVAVFWLALWELAAFCVGKEVLLPTPVRTVERLFSLLGTSLFWRDCGFSVLRVTGGFIIGNLLGLALGWISFRSKTADMFFAPVLTAVRATPVASFIILALVWIGGGGVPLFIAALMSLPVVWAGVKTALEGVDRQLVEVADVYGANTRQKLSYLYAPLILPDYLSLSATALGLAWKAGVAAEVLAVSAKSIGRHIYESKLYLETADLFAWTLALILISLALEKLFRAAVGRLGRKYSLQ